MKVRLLNGWPDCPPHPSNKLLLHVPGIHNLFSSANTHTQAGRETKYVCNIASTFETLLPFGEQILKRGRRRKVGQIGEGGEGSFIGLAKYLEG